MMKIGKLLAIILVLFTININAQGRERYNEKIEKIKSMKVAFITTELSLTPEESAKFWPIYNAFDEKKHDIRQQKLKSFMDQLDGNQIDRLSEKEAANLLSKIESNDEEIYLARKKFNSDLKAVISPLKILKLKKAEEDFGRKLLHQYRDVRKP
jgi:Spy/CpxP family protein refolding chaperone